MRNLINFKTQSTVSSLHSEICVESTFAMLIEALRVLISKNTQLEVLTLEGLLIEYDTMLLLARRLQINNSLREIDFSRSKMGGRACETLCAHIRHLLNIETLNLSGCGLTSVDMTTIYHYIRSQKIQQEIKPWGGPLRYQTNEPAASGIKRIVLSNNPLIKDAGVKVVCRALCGNSLVTEICMENCGMTEQGAKYVVKLLTINKTLRVFDIAKNPKIPQKFYSQIKEWFEESATSLSANS
jgi:centrosomal protein CEP78